MKILFIAPLPPPIHGQSYASQVFLESLKERHTLFVVDSAKPKGTGITKFIGRVFRVCAMLAQTWWGARRADRVYLTISESVPGNLKDVVTYMLCLGKLDRMYIHLHGGAGMIRIMRGNHPVLAAINRLFLRRLAGVVILGESHRRVFEGSVDPSRIHIVPNFAGDELLITPGMVVEKFSNLEPIRLLYLSNLIPGKGYQELLAAYKGLPGLKNGFRLDFAGAFRSPSDEREFLKGIAGEPGIFYHGVVHGQAKIDLFQAAHLFCLPTYYPYEGQPISILEAYAAGCAVLTTDHSGIRDVFAGGVNGYEVRVRSPESIRAALSMIAEEPGQLQHMGVRNRNEAGEKYRKVAYTHTLNAVMGLAAQTAG